MASKTVSVTVKLSKQGIQPPIFLAGSFSDPAWQPQEMQHATNETGDYEFHKEVEVEQGKEYQYKFRIGEQGDWWVLNEESPTGMCQCCVGVVSGCRWAARQRKTRRGCD
jgi:hypothetical protein